MTDSEKEYYSKIWNGWNRMEERRRKEAEKQNKLMGITLTLFGVLLIVMYVGYVITEILQHYHA